jgi:hypothetical protein
MQSIKVFDGVPYRAYDRYPTKTAAETVASALRTPQGSPFAPARTHARVVDLGVMEGRLRYAVYIRPGE